MSYLLIRLFPSGGTVTIKNGTVTVGGITRSVDNLGIITFTEFSCPGTFTITASAPGYTTKTETLTCSEWGNVLDITLAPSQTPPPTQPPTTPGCFLGDSIFRGSDNCSATIVGNGHLGEERYDYPIGNFTVNILKSWGCYEYNSTGRSVLEIYDRPSDSWKYLAEAAGLSGYGYVYHIYTITTTKDEWFRIVWDAYGNSTGCIKQFRSGNPLPIGQPQPTTPPPGTPTPPPTPKKYTCQDSCYQPLFNTGYDTSAECKIACGIAPPTPGPTPPPSTPTPPPPTGTPPPGTPGPTPTPEPGTNYYCTDNCTSPKYKYGYSDQLSCKYSCGLLPPPTPGPTPTPGPGKYTCQDNCGSAAFSSGYTTQAECIAACNTPSPTPIPGTWSIATAKSTYSVGDSVLINYCIGNGDGIYSIIYPAGNKSISQTKLQNTCSSFSIGLDNIGIYKFNVEDSLGTIRDSKQINVIAATPIPTPVPTATPPPGTPTPVYLTVSSKTLYVGQTLSVNACAPNGILQFVKPDGGINQVAIPINGCISDSFTPTTSGLAIARIKDTISGNIIASEQVTFLPPGIPTPTPPPSTSTPPPGTSTPPPGTPTPIPTPAPSINQIDITLAGGLAGINEVRCFGTTYNTFTGLYESDVIYTIKKLCNGSTCKTSFTEADRLAVGRYYYFSMNTAAVQPKLPANSVMEFRGYKSATLNQGLPGTYSASICSLLDITTDCLQYLAGFPLEFLTPIADAYVILNGKSIYDNSSQTPTWWNYFSFALGCLPIVGGTFKMVGKAKLMEKAVELVDLAKKNAQIAAVFESESLLRRLPSMQEFQIDNLITSIKTGTVADVSNYLRTFPLKDYTYDQKISWEQNLGRLLDSLHTERTAANALKLTEFGYKYQKILEGYFLNKGIITSSDAIEFLTKGTTDAGVDEVWGVMRIFTQEDLTSLVNKLKTAPEVHNSVLGAYLGMLQEYPKQQLTDVSRHLLADLAKLSNTAISTPSNAPIFKTAADVLKETVSGSKGLVDNLLTDEIAAGTATQATRDSAKAINDEILFDVQQIASNMVNSSPLNWKDVSWTGIKKTVSHLLDDLTWANFKSSIRAIRLKKIAYWMGRLLTILGIDFAVVWFIKEGLLDIPSFALWMAAKPNSGVSRSTQLSLLVQFKENIDTAEPLLNTLSYINPFFWKTIPEYIASVKITHDMYAEMIGVPERKYAQSIKRFPESFNAKVTKIIDGDTIEAKTSIPQVGVPEETALSAKESIVFKANSDAMIKGTTYVTGDFESHVRLLGINTPEGKDLTYLIRRLTCPTCVEERWNATKIIYDSIKQKITSRLYSTDVVLKTDLTRQFDAYGRLLAVIYINGTDFNKEQLTQGHAPVFFYDNNNKINTADYLAEEEKAKTARLGVWSISPGCTAQSKPTALFSMSPNSPDVGIPIQFTDSSTPGPIAGQTIISWLWNFGDGTSSTERNPTKTYTTTGSKTVILTVKNSCGESDPFSKSFTIGTAPTPTPTPTIPKPSASFVNIPTTPTDQDTITFDASASGPGSGSGATITKYEWFSDNVVFATGVTAAKKFPTGQYIIQLKVTNNSGGTENAVKTLTVKTAATPAPGSIPSPSFINSPSSPQSGDTVTFDASASDPGTGATITKYEWFINDILFASGPTTSTTSKVLIEGSYIVKVKITNSFGNSDLAVKSITVKPISATGSTPTASFINAPSSGLQAGQTVVFDASSSNPGSGATITGYQWYSDNTLFSSGPAPTAIKTFTEGTPIIKLIVTNSFGKTDSTSKVLTISSGIPATPKPGTPTASFVLSPTSPLEGEIITMDASASSPGANSTITTCDWYIDTQKIATGITAYKSLAAGSYIIKATITNSAGLSDTAIKVVTVKPATQPAGSNPTASFVHSPTTPQNWEQVTFDASASNPGSGATITGYQWYADDVLISATVTALKSFPEGQPIIKLIVTNSFGNKDTTIKILTIKPAATPPPQTGSLTVKAKDSAGNPLSSVVVYVDGIDKSSAPVTVNNLSVGTHTVRLEKSGYMACKYCQGMSCAPGQKTQPCEFTVNVTENTITVYEVTMLKTFTVTLASSPPNAVITVNGSTTAARIKVKENLMTKLLKDSNVTNRRS